MGDSFDEVELGVWGKRRGLSASYPLLFHLLDTAAVVFELWDRFLVPNQRRVIAAGMGVDERSARGLVAFWAGLHDLGKLTPGFQQFDADAYRDVDARLRSDAGTFDVVPHARASMYCAYGLLADLDYAKGRRSTSPLRRVAQILGGHHGRYEELNADRAELPAFTRQFGGPKWAEQRAAYVRCVHELLGSPQPPRTLTSHAAVLVTGLVILADWLASQEEHLENELAGLTASPEIHWDRARKAAPGLVAEAGLIGCELARKEFRDVHNIQTPNPLQYSIIEELRGAVRGPGLLVVTAATGDGKTEAALEAERVLAEASGSSGFCFVLPTMATADEMYRRVARFVAAQAPHSAAVALTHSTAWLSEAYGDQQLAENAAIVSDDESGVGDSAGRATAPPVWLRGSKRALLARFAVGTIDQSLLAVLPVKHNALRMLALSGKTFIVDEAHAYDPYMQVLLARLLTWLGSYGCSVVLLSATLPGSVSDKLVRAYVTGAGQTPAGPYQVPYPGWLFVDATGKVATISGARQDQQTQSRAVTLSVDVRPVRHLAAKPGQALPREARLSVIGDLLRPLGHEGGCAAVVCTTVDDAQTTYRHLKEHREEIGLRADEVRLLHARLPAEDREERTRGIVEILGRTGRMEGRLVVVATAVIEQSLDLDLDLMISDLAPISLLLQRAGRCWRHEAYWATHSRPVGRERRAWARGPRLVVLDPVDVGGAFTVPKHWGEQIYHPYLLAATSRLLAARQGAPIAVPGDVQELVEAVYGPGSEFDARRAAFDGQNLAEASIANVAAIPPPRLVLGLDDLHRAEASFDEIAARTRLGADSVRALCCYRQEDGRLTLRRSGGELPAFSRHGFDPRAVRAVMRRTMPLRADLVRGLSQQPPPPGWTDNPHLSELVLLVHEIHAGRVDGVVCGKHKLTLGDDLGLVVER